MSRGRCRPFPEYSSRSGLELFTENGTAKNGAAMFFGKQPERKFPHATTRCVLFKGTNKVYIIDDKTFGGSLYQQYLQAIAWLESKLQVAYKIEGTGVHPESPGRTRHGSGYGGFR